MSEDKLDYMAIVRDMSPEKWAEVFSTSSRKARETYFHRHGIRKPKQGIKINRGGGNEVRVARLFDLLKGEDDVEMVEEIVRVYLLSRRDILVTALDHLGIENDEGLTESDDVDKIKDLKGKELKKLCDVMVEKHSKDDVLLYLRFMGATKVEELLE